LWHATAEAFDSTISASVSIPLFDPSIYKPYNITISYIESKISVWLMPLSNLILALENVAYTHCSMNPLCCLDIYIVSLDTPIPNAIANPMQGAINCWSYSFNYSTPTGVVSLPWGGVHFSIDFEVEEETRATCPRPAVDNGYWPSQSASVLWSSL